MSTPIGFVLLVNPFNKLEQSARLIRTLNRMFNHPPIACHHDFGKNPRFIDDCPANVQIVRPHLNTKWGDFSCVEAMVQALQLLYADGDAPEWFVYLSGSDYPIKPADKILHDLRQGQFDGYIEHQLVSSEDFTYLPDLKNRQGWKWETWLKDCHKRYCSLRVDVPGINRYLRFSKRTFWLQHPIFTRSRLPFTPEFKCYAGEAWFSANHRCAHRILDFFPNHPAITAHYRRVLVPEESYFQSVLGSASNLRLSQNYLRYVDWTQRKSNPKILTSSDLPELSSSDAHFARKFDEEVDVDVLDELDRWVS